MASEQESFGQWLRYLRKERGLTARYLAATARIDHSYLSKIENERRGPPSRGICLVLASALSLDVFESDQFLELAGHSSLLQEEELPETMPPRGREILIQTTEELRMIFSSDTLPPSAKDSLLGLFSANLRIVEGIRESWEFVL